ncbi:MAG: FecCD family ABC transporter permease [Acidimicrobiales bacterium]|jgi:iron complex transport system permease protein
MRTVVATSGTGRLGAFGLLLRRGASAPTLRLFDDGGEEEPKVFPTRLRAFHVGIGICFLLGAAVVSLLIGPADLSPGAVLKEMLSRLPLVPVHSGLSATGVAVVWQLRVPRIVLGGLVGSMLALAGSSYQGVFHNPLADPYLLGVASGAGLGATIAVIEIPHLVSWSVNPVPIAAFIGAVVAVSATFALGRSGNQARNATTLVLGGIAVGAFFTAVQTFLLQQQNPQVLAEVYDWILGGLSTGWEQVGLILPYLVVSTVVLLACRRLLDALSVGDDEANSLGVRADRIRLVIVAAATLGTAAAVSVSGLIGFVGIIVPHTIRLIAGPSYQRILPLSVLFGAGFLILADLLARTVLSPSEIPLGVVTAFMGAPFFLIVLRQARTFS